MIDEKFTKLALEIIAKDFGEQVVDKATLVNITRMLEYAHKVWEDDREAYIKDAAFESARAMEDIVWSPATSYGIGGSFSTSGMVYPPKPVAGACVYCGADHPSWDCPSLKPRSEYCEKCGTSHAVYALCPGSRLICSKCGGSHDATTCPIVCSVCSSSSHTASTCPVLLDVKYSPKKKTTVIPSSLFGRKEHKCSFCGGDHWDGYCRCFGR